MKPKPMERLTDHAGYAAALEELEGARRNVREHEAAKPGQVSEAALGVALLERGIAVADEQFDEMQRWQARDVAYRAGLKVAEEREAAARREACKALCSSYLAEHRAALGAEFAALKAWLAARGRRKTLEIRIHTATGQDELRPIQKFDDIRLLRAAGDGFRQDSPGNGTGTVGAALGDLTPLIEAYVTGD
jgi:hypothetical protein